MPDLMVNIDHVATIRQARGTYFPDPVYAAGIAEMAGASGIIIHLREDRRHIKDRDVRLLREVVRTKLNLEMAATDEMVEIARDVVPDMITLVPEKREELTTEGGLDAFSLSRRLKKVTEKVREKGIKVSLFIDPEEKQVMAAKKIGADMIEIHTGAYSDAINDSMRRQEYKKVVEAAKKGKELGLGVNAGHGLHYHNVREIAKIEEIDELSIGHSIIARAVFVGLDRAIRDMLELING
ncbi:MAG TPA: pyridoxine 5'-phosphate synthase [Syntrophorhabdaceae bacterium]|nr:pyridoxine 5'-phosphate synthase [Syntrophorhabdaceae bacterium]HOL05929.1 pyridoxine 5'-phosphate synthase [Syntrophorhabdaceae bacterium]HON86185.1 pyridoxine 5'-phosphate synthase [Syntrophorhabdaceae bacterium]HOT42509.1 pyridoxine 5'-phosphate synthase [Syntrophorhabdaceae bacterium]HPC67608.1 pyridoxine 5'-phosphate synthase [Syntrophorhabdaceae bacterium]